MNYLMLVNKNNLFKEELLSNIKLVKTCNFNSEEILIEEETYHAFLKLKDFLKEHEVEVALDLVYRSLEEQQRIQEEFILQYGVEYTLKVVAPVGASEHHTGLGIDFLLKVDGLFDDDNNDIMNHVEKYKELEPFLSSFGFILRYPEGKEEITGYPYEPWHIRYVKDKKVAEEIMVKKLTLEEYLEK